MLLSHARACSSQKLRDQNILSAEKLISLRKTLFHEIGKTFSWSLSSFPVWESLLLSYCLKVNTHQWGLKVMSLSQTNHSPRIGNCRTPIGGCTRACSAGTCFLAACRWCLWRCFTSLPIISIFETWICQAYLSSQFLKKHVPNNGFIAI